MSAPRLRASKNRPKYKTLDAFLNAVYRKNKAYIDTHIDPALLTKHTPKSVFKFLIKDQMQYTNQKTGKKYTVYQAMKRVTNSKEMNPSFTTSDIYHANFEQLLRKDKNVFKKFRESTRNEKGRYTSYDYSKLQFEGYYAVNNSNSAVYRYDDLIIIEAKSPQPGQGASIQIMDIGDFDMAVGKNIHFIGKTRRK